MMMDLNLIFDSIKKENVKQEGVKVHNSFCKELFNQENNPTASKQYSEGDLLPHPK